MYHTLSEQMSYSIETDLRCFAKFVLNIYLITSYMSNEICGFVNETFPLIVAKFGKHIRRVEAHTISFNICEN